MHFDATAVRELTVTRKQRLRFLHYAPAAKTVYLGGNFVPLHQKFIHMLKAKDGIWYAYVMLSAGHYHYSFYVETIEETSAELNTAASSQGASVLVGHSQEHA